MTDIHYRTYLIALAIVTYTLIIGMTFGAFGVFVHPVSAEFKLSRAEMNTALALLSLGNAFLAPVLGRILDRVHPGRVMVVGGAAMAVAYAALALSPSARLDAFAIVLLVPIGFSAGGAMTIPVLITRWFAANRARAMALTGVGMHLGSTVIAPLAGLLVQDFGWRTALLVLAGLAGLVLIPFGFTIRLPARPLAVEDGQVQAQEPAVTEAQPETPSKIGPILRSASFWAISVSGAIGFLMSQVTTVSLVPMAVEGGLSPMEGASLISLMGVGSIAGTLLLSVFADKIDRMVLLSVIIAMWGVACVGFQLAAGYQALAAVAVFAGLTGGTLTPTFYTVLADRFGVPSYGTVRGLAIPITAIIGMVGVRLVGEVFDRTGGYSLTFNVLLVLQVLAAITILITRFGLRSAAAKRAPAV